MDSERAVNVGPAINADPDSLRRRRLRKPGDTRMQTLDTPQMHEFRTCLSIVFVQSGG